MFINILDYIQKPKDQRQHHIDLNEPCIKIGGRSSSEYRGLLAHYLHTTIPTGKKVVLCHACNYHWCSNPKHMYWGTQKENVHDAIIAGTHSSFWERQVKKYGYEEARNRASKRSIKAWVNRDHKDAFKTKNSADEIQRRRDVIMSCNVTKLGWVNEASKKLNISHTSVKKFVDAHMKDVLFFRRVNSSQ